MVAMIIVGLATVVVLFRSCKSVQIMYTFLALLVVVGIIVVVIIEGEMLEVVVVIVAIVLFIDCG